MSYKGWRKVREFGVETERELSSVVCWRTAPELPIAVKRVARYAGEDFLASQGSTVLDPPVALAQAFPASSHLGEISGSALSQLPVLEDSHGQGSSSDRRHGGHLHLAYPPSRAVDASPDMPVRGYHIRSQRLSRKR